MVTNTKILKRSLQNLGVSKESIVCVYDGVEALEQSQSQKRKFSVVFMDHEMPQMTGSEAAKKMRTEGFKGWIAGLTGNASKKSQAAFLDAGLDEMIVKPFKQSELSSTIASAVLCESRDFTMKRKR